MKVKNYLLSCFTGFIFIACNAGKDQNAVQEKVAKAIDTSREITRTGHNTATEKNDTAKYSDTSQVKSDTLFTMVMDDNKGSVHAYLNGIGRQVTIIVPVSKGDSIEAEILPDDKAANIRFNQVYIPAGKEGKYDGPFSRKLVYPVTVKGNYRLIVGPSLMAEGNPKGYFTCNVFIR